MSARNLLALACVVALGLCAWLLSTGKKAAPVLAQEPGQESGIDGSANDERTDLAPARPTRANPVGEAREPLSGPPSLGRESVEVAAEAVEVHVRLALASGERCAFAGWRVEIQTWIEATNETFPHEAFANASGLADFTFPGFVHVDWIRCVPSPETGLALAVSEHHADLDPGESLEETLELEPGGILRGRVVDERDLPVAGVSVHAYRGDAWNDLGEFQPGVAEVVTGSDGGYALPPLPPGDWCVAVPPREWLQVDPPPGDAQAGRTGFQLTAGAEFVAADLRVVPLHRLRVRVLAGDGAPVSGARVLLEPLDLRASGMQAKAPEPPDELDLFLGRAEPVREDPLLRPWPYGDLERVTGPEGEAVVVGVRGAWRLSAWPLLTDVGSASARHLEVDLPGPDRTLRLGTALLAHRGLVVDEGGQPIARATARLTRRDDGVSSQWSVTDAKGRFSFEGLPPSGQYTLALSHPGHLSAEWPVRLGDDGRFELRRAGSVRLRLVDADGGAVARREVQVLSTRPLEATRPSEARGVERLLATRFLTDLQGRIRIGPVPRGQLQVGLLLPFEVSGSPGQLESRLFRSWVVPVEDPEQVLTVDLSAHAAPLPRKPPLHVGHLRDADSGAPLVGGVVFVRTPNALQGCATGPDGRFRLVGLSEAHALIAMSAGYRPLLVPAREWGPGEHEHEFSLQAGSVQWNLTFADRDGQRLPTLRVRARDLAGEPALQIVRLGERLQPWNGWMQAQDGRLTVLPTSLDPVDFELFIEGHSLGHVGFEPHGPGVSDLELRLPRTLEELRVEIENRLADEGD